MVSSVRKAQKNPLGAGLGKEKPPRWAVCGGLVRGNARVGRVGKRKPAEAGCLFVLDCGLLLTVFVRLVPVPPECSDHR